MDIQYIERSSGELQTEKIYGRWALAFLYGDSFFNRLFSFFILPLLAHLPWFSRFYGYLQKRPKSAKKITPFIEAYHIDTSEFVETSFPSFNDFFIRKLKFEKRPIVSDPRQAAMPADGRYLVFPDLKKTETFYVKGQKFDLEKFLEDPVLAHRYAQGAMVIARLCPTDYHRFHFPCNGIPRKARLINGPLFSVNPIALRKNLAILWENKRMITEMETEQFGTIQYIEVGATCVGSIQQTYFPDNPMRKGDEKGYFEFGGSCLVLLFEKETIVFDDDLIANSARGLETRANFGKSLGTAS